MADIGTGITIGFSGGFTAEILKISSSGVEVPVIDTSHHGTTGSRTKMVADLIDEGDIDVELQFDPDTLPPLKITQTVTITFPVPAGLTNGATLVGSGAITKRDWEVPHEDKMTGKYTMTWLGAVTPTVAS